MNEPNTTQRTEWNGESGRRWVADADRRDVVLKPVLDALISAARIHPSDNILDIGCGCGATTLAAASQLTTGRAIGVDLSQTMLSVAQARAAGNDRVEFAEADAQVYPFSPAADLVISRFGTMFFDDPVAAFANIRRGTSDHGRLCIATWQPLAANEWLVVPGAILLKYADIPPFDQPGPGMFSLSDPAAVTALLGEAGWSSIRVEPRQIDLRVGSDPADAVDYLAAAGPARRALDAISPDRQAEALADLTQALAGHVSDGVRLKAGIHLIHALPSR